MENAAAAAAPRRIETVQGYVNELETLLGRRWTDADVARMFYRLTQINVHHASLDQQVQEELRNLRGQREDCGRLPEILYGYFDLLCRAWPAMEVAPPTAPSPPPTEMAGVGSHLDDSWMLSDDEDEDDDEEEEDETASRERVASRLRTRKVGEKDAHGEKEMCCVCLEDLYRGTVATLECGHEFHADCITEWLVRGRNFCPLCKARALPSD